MNEYTIRLKIGDTRIEFTEHANREIEAKRKALSNITIEKIEILKNVDSIIRVEFLLENEETVKGLNEIIQKCNYEINRNWEKKKVDKWKNIFKMAKNKLRKLEKDISNFKV